MCEYYQQNTIFLTIEEQKTFIGCLLFLW